MGDNAWARLGKRLQDDVERARRTRMQRLGDPNALPRMPEREWTDQPRNVWRFVEAEAHRQWPFKCQQTIDRVAGVTDGPTPGWLNTYRGLYAEAIDVPIGRLFLAYSLLHKAGRLPEDTPRG